MIYEAKSLGKVKGLGEIFQVCAPLDKQIKALAKVGVREPYLATPEQVANIRLAGTSLDFSRTSFAPVKAKGEPTILYRDSPLMNPLMAVVVVNAHRNLEYPLFSRDVYEAVRGIAKSQEGLAPEDRDAHILQGKADNEGKFQLVPEADDTRFILRKATSDYFKKFSHVSIPFYDITADLPKDKSAVNYLWFSRPDLGSGLGARDGGALDGGRRAFGVYDRAEGTQKNLGYTLTEIGQAVDKSVPQFCERKKIVGLESLIVPVKGIILSNLRTQTL